MPIIDVCKSVSTYKSSGGFSAFVFRAAIFIQASPQSNVCRFPWNFQRLLLHQQRTVCA